MTDRLADLKAALADHYLIERELGAGGMATVYLAEDVKHHREVAVKVLKPELAAVLGAERFVQEITTTASLQHPHILPLFDSGEADGFLYYVMPYIEGETLRAKLDRETQLGIDEAVKITTEVADSLSYAHSHGVIHRDIKPENILLESGHAVVADFGIALAVSAAAGGRMTETGLSLGTPHYMSPEQATAEKDLTNRSDIYSLGAVLYEMLTGDPPHTGSSAQQIIMKIVTEEVLPVTRVRKAVPRNVAAAVAKALEKLPADRFETAAALGQALSNPAFLADHATMSHRHRQVATPRLKTYGGWAVSLAMAAALAWAWATRPTTSSSVELSPRFNINLDSAPMTFIGAASLGIGRRNLAISRDGTVLAYVGVRDGGTQLFVRPLDEYGPRALAGTEGAYAPFFSPNGRYIGFFVENELRKVAIDGGDPIVLATVANPMGGDWGLDDRIIFAGREGTELLRVSADGGPVERVFQVGFGPSRGGARESDVQDVQFPNLLPDGKTVLVSGFPGQAAIIDLSTRNAKILRSPATDVRYVAPGIVVYVEGSTLFASKFDDTRHTLIGQSVPVLTGVRSEVYGIGQWAVSESGDLVYAPGRAVAEGPLTWLESDGSVAERLEFSVRRHGTFELAPGGRRLAIDVTGPAREVWIYDLATRGEQKLSIAGNGYRPNWSADGARVLFRSDRSNATSHYVRTVDAGVEEEELSVVPEQAWVHSWSPDGRFMVFSTAEEERTTLAALEVETGEVQLIHESAAQNWGGVFSPDGRAIAYTSDETGEYHVYVEPFPPTGLRRTASRDGGAEEPVWAPDGDRLYFRSGQRLMSVNVRWDPELVVGPPTMVFERDWVNVGGRSYEISPDGRRFLVIDPASSTTATLNVVLNWVSEVRLLMDEANR